MSSQPPSERPYFDSIPWCATLLSAPNVTVFTPPSRLVKYSSSKTTMDQFFGRTLHTAQTIPHSICFYTSPTFLASSTSSSSSSSSATTSSPLSPLEEEKTEERELGYVKSCTALHALSLGLTGFANVVHGGLIASLLDEAMGVLIELNQMLLGCSATQSTLSATHLEGIPQVSRGKQQVNKLGIWGMNVYTANLDIKFRRPVGTPQAVLAEGWVDEIEGRKMRMRAEVRNQEGMVLAECSSLWIGVPREKL